MDEEDMAGRDEKKGADGANSPLVDEVNGVILEADENSMAALSWLRRVLASIFEVAPLPQWQKKRASHLLNRLPDWIMAKWACALNIDYLRYYRTHPDLAKEMSGHGNRKTVEQYVEEHHTVLLANTLKQLVQSVLKQWKAGKLPIDEAIVKRGVCAPAFVGCTPAGLDFSEKVRAILSSYEPKNQLLTDYRLALDGGQKNKLADVNAALAGGRYGNWVDERIVEFRRYLGLEAPLFLIQFGRRTPQWDALWQDIVKGG